MKRRIAATLCAVFMIAGCGQGSEPVEQAPVQDEQQDLKDSKEDEMQAELDEVPEELPAEDAAARGFYTIANGEVVGGEDVWEAFVAADAQGLEASVVVCQYTREGGALLDYVYRRPEGGYLVVSDSTRDELATEANLHRTQEFSSMNVFKQFKLTEDGKEYTICVLSNEPEMDEETFRTYWREMTAEAHQTYLLFVI